jgi:branched-chain amino acid transport system permease protein
MTSAASSLGIATSVDVLMAAALYLSFATGSLFILPIGSMAVGAYTFGWLTAHGTSTLEATVIGVLGGGVLTAVGGLLSARMSGWSSAMAGFAMAEIVQTFFFNFGPTGGAAGLTGVALSTTFGEAVIITVVVLLGILWFELSRPGLKARAIRADGLSAECSGITVWRVRVILFTVGGLIAGAAGVLNAGFLGFISPASYGLEQLNSFIVAPVLGGSETIVGSAVGGTVTSVLPTYVGSLAQYSLVAFGLIVIVLMLLRRGGLISGRSVRLAAEWARLKRPSKARLEQSAGRGARSLRIEHISKSFGGNHVLKDVSFAVEAASIHGLIGSNGAGKTTLLNAISGIVAPDSGHIHLGDTSLTRKSVPARVRLGLSRTFQNIRLYGDLTVAEHVETASEHNSVAVIEMLGLQDFAALLPKNLPYGSQRKVEIARAAVLRPRVLLLDEPAAGMAGNEMNELAEIIFRLRANGATILVIDHNVGFIRRIAETITVLNFGEVIAQGAPEDVLANPAVIDAYLGQGITRSTVPTDDHAGGDGLSDEDVIA